MQSEGIPQRDRNDEMPSGLENGPENSRSTQWDEDARSRAAWRRERGAGSAASDTSARSGGRPGG
eukprot:1548208-Pleurochrysis_carterae.AAC.2